MLLLVKARGAYCQEVYCQGTVGSTSFNATGAVTITTATDLNTALVVATDPSQPTCTSVITIGAPGTYVLSKSYTIPPIASLTLQAGPGLGPNDIILMAATSTRHFAVFPNGVLVATGIQFTGGKVPDDDGGAIYNYGNVKVSDCIFSSNEARNGGSLMLFAGGELTASNCTFSSNKADEYGGAVEMLNGATLVINYCTFRSNYALSGGAIKCGDYLGDGGYLFATGCTFDSNSASGKRKGIGGGAIMNVKVNIELVDCTFTNNEETAGDGAAADYGGGAIATRGYTICTGCTFTNNRARNNGGAVLNYNPNSLGEKTGLFFTCYGCNFQNNNAGQGGAIWNRFGENTCNANDPSNLPCQSNGLTLMYCTWWGNSVTSGSYKTRGSNTFVYATNGCWCTYLTGTSDPAGGINRDDRCQCNPEGAPTASPTPAPTGPTPAPTPVSVSGVNQSNCMGVPPSESSRTIVMLCPLTPMPTWSVSD